MLRPKGLIVRSEDENVCVKAHRESKLTFVVIWDPETGMQSFAGDSLETLRDYQKADDICHVSHEDFIIRRLPPRGPPIASRDPPLRGYKPKHFNVVSNEPESGDAGGSMGSRGSDDYTFNVDSVLFSDSDSILTELDETEIRYYRKLDHSSSDSPASSPLDPPGHTPSVPFTPNSVFTFAGLWDPKRKRLSTCQDGKIVKSVFGLGSSNVAASSSGGGSRRYEPSNAEEIDEGVQELVYVPQVHDSMDFGRDAIASSTLAGVMGPWRGHDIPGSDEDEGFFETVADCNPANLPSRFSMTTTSTSRYVRIESGYMPSPGPDAITFMGRKPATQRKPSNVLLSLHNQYLKPPSKVRVAETDLSNTAGAAPPPSSSSSSTSNNKENIIRRRMSLPNPSPSPSSAFTDVAIQTPIQIHRKQQTPKLSTKLSQVFRAGFAPKKPRPIDDKWVVVDVKSVITERLLDV